MEGPSEARKLSMACGVPRTKMYGTLKKLVERGLVVEIPEEPREFAVTSPDNAFNTFLQSLKTDLSERVTSLVEFENAISFLGEIYKKRQSIKPIDSQMGDVWFTHGRPETLQRTGEMLPKAKRSIDIMTTENGLILFYKAFDKLLDKMAEKGTKIRIKARLGPSNRRLIQELRYAYEVKQAGVIMPILFVCIDESKFVLVRLRPDNDNLESSEDFGFYSQNRNLCAFFFSLLGLNQK